MSQILKEIEAIDRELQRGNREIQKSQRFLDGWANRVMKALHIDDYADYPKRSNKQF